MINTKMRIALATIGVVATVWSSGSVLAASPVVVNLKVTKDFTGGYNADIVLDAAAKAMLSSNPTLSFKLGHTIKSAFGASIVSNTSSAISLNKISQYSVGYTDTNSVSSQLSPSNCSFAGQPCILQVNGVTRWSPVTTTTPTATPTKAATATPTPTKSPTATPTVIATATKAPTTTPTVTKSPTVTPTATSTATKVPTVTPSATPTATSSPTPTPTGTGVTAVWGQNFNSLSDGSTWLTSGCKNLKKGQLVVVSNCGGEGASNKCLKAIYDPSKNEPWDPNFYKTWVADFSGMPSSDPLAGNPHYSYTAVCAPYYTGTATDVLQQILPIGGEDSTKTKAFVDKWSGTYANYKPAAAKLPATEYTLNYDVMFLQSKNEPSVVSNAVFEWARGGKLPGLAAAAADSGCTDEGRLDKNNPLNWSMRMMWRADGTNESYIYDQGRADGSCGARVTTTSPSGSITKLSAKKWYSLTMYVKLNTFVGGVAQADGVSEMYIYDNGILVGSAKSTGIKYRGIDDEATKIHNLFFSTFYGGNEQKRMWRKWACDNANGDAGRAAVCAQDVAPNTTWEPAMGIADIPNTIYFDNFAVYPGSTPRIRTGFGK